MANQPVGLVFKNPFLAPTTTSSANNAVVSTTPPVKKTCWYCGADYYTGTFDTPCTHAFLRYRMDEHTWIETCENEMGKFISRNMNSRYVDKNGDPK
jgi:hypothetical protein